MTDLGRPDDAEPDRTGATRHRAPDPASRGPRPLVERLGLAFIAAIAIAVFVVIAAASFASGDPFLALMAGSGR